MTVPTSGKGKNINLLTAANPMDAYNMPEITLGTIKAADGKTDLYYRLIKPVNYDPNKKYPAVIYVYGGPHAQMIHNVRNYGAGGWDIYMAQLGYVMLTVDSRGSDNRGLEFVLPIPGKCPMAAVTFCSCNPVCMPVTKDATVAASVP